MLYLVICGFVAGVILTLVAQFLFCWRWFHSLPVLTPTWKPQTESYLLPKELSDQLKDDMLKKQKEPCFSLNLILQFLFQELKDTKRIRRWVMKRMKIEFDEMLKSTTGKFVEHITVRDFNVGRTFPIFKNAAVENVSLNDDNMIEEVTVSLDLTYNGRFQLAVDVDMVFGKSAYLSVVLTKLQGPARLQFTRQPYTHWSFAFTEDPVLLFEVESHFEGRPIAQLTSVIINQIRKVVRKKHTFPSYKIRYRPFFVMPVSESAPQSVYYHGTKLTIGRLQVVVVGCTRLITVLPDSHIYCSLALDSIQWMELMRFRRKLWMAHDVEVVRVSGQGIGFTFGEVFLVDKYEEVVVVTAVVPGSPAAKADIQKNDLLVAINGVRVTNNKQAVRLMKNSPEKMTLRLERAIKGYSGSAQRAPSTHRSEDDTSSVKAFHATTGNVQDLATDVPTVGNQNGDVEMSDFVPVLLPQSEVEKTSHDETLQTKNLESKSDFQISQSSSSVSLSSSSAALISSNSASYSPPMAKKGLTQQILSTGSGIFQRRKLKSEAPPGTVDVTKTPSSNVQPPPKAESSSSDKEKKSLTNGGKVDLAVQSVPQRENQNNKKHETQTTTADPVEKKSREPNQQTASTSNSSSTGNNMDKTKMRTTCFSKASSNPTFGDKFDFDVAEKHNYLNICVWNKQPEKLDKQSRIIKPEKDVLLGHISIPLMDIALECLSTLQGDVTNVYNLTPSESKVETGRQYSNLSSHSGFEERLCYGDVSLRFSYAMGSLSKADRDDIVKMREENEQTSSLEQASDLTKLDGFTNNLSSATTTAPRLVDQHNFMMAHFQTATYCDFCSKKIWLKSAFQCQLCQMVCHKKCTEKCQAQKKCSKVPIRVQKKERLKDALQETNVSAEVNPQKSATEPTEESKAGEQINGDVERKRHNSAPDESHSESDTKDHSESSSTTVALPRTRSSTSLGDMSVEALLMPTTKSLEDAEVLCRMFRRVQHTANSDELVVTQAKKMGKELYANLEPEARKEKLDSTILKLQVEIDSESAHRASLIGRERAATDKKIKKSLQDMIEKSDGKLQSLTVLMLHYCAGLQHCMDQEELERQRRLEQEHTEQQLHKEEQAQDEKGKEMELSTESVDTSREMDVSNEDILVKAEALPSGAEEEMKLEDQMADDSVTGPDIMIDDDSSECDEDDFVHDDNIESLEDTEFYSLMETVEMSSPVGTYLLMNTDEDDTIEQLTQSEINQETEAEFSTDQIFPNSSVEADVVPENDAETSSVKLSEESVMHDITASSDIHEELTGNYITPELFSSLPHSNPETVVDETSVIDTSIQSENTSVTSNVEEAEDPIMQANGTDTDPSLLTEGSSIATDSDPLLQTIGTSTESG